METIYIYSPANGYLHDFSSDKNGPIWEWSHNKKGAWPIRKEHAEKYLEIVKRKGIVDAVLEK